MSLPAGEQQILDRIAETLRASEPRLVSMFAIFGRLFRNDGPPLRERLPAARPFARLAALRRRLATMRHASAPDAGLLGTDSSGTGSSGTSALRTGSPGTGSSGTSELRTGSSATGVRGLRPRGRRTVWQLVFVFANVVAAVAIVAVMIALNTHPAPACTQRPSTMAPVYVFRSGNCPAHTVSGGSAPRR